MFAATSCCNFSYASPSQRTSLLLAEALASERQSGERELAELASTERRAANEAEEKARRALAEVLERCDALVAEKASCAKQIAKSGERLRRAQEASSAAVAEERRKAEEELAAARRTWKEGEAARRQRFLARKAEVWASEGGISEALRGAGDWRTVETRSLDTRRGARESRSSPAPPLWQDARVATVEGLQPEMDALTGRHAAALATLAEEAAAQLAEDVAALQAAHDDACADLRDCAATKQVPSMHGALCASAVVAACKSCAAQSSSDFSHFPTRLVCASLSRPTLSGCQGGRGGAGVPGAAGLSPTGAGRPPPCRVPGRDGAG